LPQVYVVLHEGYTFERIEEEYNTYAEALEGLKAYLERAISEEEAERGEDDEDDSEGDEEDL
jgi:hydrogenase maturation factor